VALAALGSTQQDAERWVDSGVQARGIAVEPDAELQACAAQDFSIPLRGDLAVVGDGIVAHVEDAHNQGTLIWEATTRLSAHGDWSPSSFGCKMEQRDILGEMKLLAK